MIRAARGAPWMLVLLTLACAAIRPTPARVRVELLRGFEAAPVASSNRVALLVDVTRSMVSATDAGPTRNTVARAAARRFVAGLPDDTVVSLHALGVAAGACAEAVHEAADAEIGLSRDALTERIGALSSRGEGSLSDALRAMALASDGDPRGPQRVVAFTDLGGECGSDLCAAADEFGSRGVRLDLVVVGDAAAPACLREAATLMGDAPAARLAMSDSERFHVEMAHSGELPITHCGEINGAPLAISPGSGTLTLDLEPPLHIDRSFPPGSDVVLQVIDFPALDPPVRRWRWQAASRNMRSGEVGEP